MNFVLIQKLLSVVYFALALALSFCMVGGLLMGERHFDSGFCCSVAIALLLACLVRFSTKFRNSTGSESFSFAEKRSAPWTDLDFDCFIGTSFWA